MKIVIAEDDAVDLQLLPLTLDRMGQEVVVTRTRTEAWETFRSRPGPPCRERLDDPPGS